MEIKLCKQESLGMPLV